MVTYAALLLPSANRVYARSAIDLMVAELKVLNQAVLAGRLQSIEHRTIGGIGYVTFSTESPLTEDESDLLSNLSTVYALFRREGELLAPVPLNPLQEYDDDLLTILKYSGKTNQEFTKLLLNVTLWSSAFGDRMRSRRFSVLDPLCGRGTTLNQALMYGYDATGVDIDKSDFDAYSAFIRTYLKNKRLKHSAEIARLRRDGKVLGKQLTVTMAPDKSRYKEGDVQHLSVCNLDTTEGRKAFRAQSFDLLVTDLPYGVQHGSHSRQDGLRRGPLALLDAALPSWLELMRPGGALGISWNTNVAGRDDVLEVLRAAGLEPLDSEIHRGFVHRVDQAIVRDIMVARIPV
ncbi:MULTISPECIES: TRM11 family SAM-dependent methyltransferase [Actinoalloteichus]|uniref:Methyltransferase domain n=1 Tax=Actinoalloteichus fjordicus TaxID=1612552 RepID=A0AAC9L8I8_9PSEU|nr:MULTISPECIES: SAM-dependent methyltransferase [Actinoalloteichus]APU13138.1 Methyltransferase domain [Actinoalloteichus fjordicus]APU19088.1 Methyltransferase domain [Actinoalloteichus sp. GBA129-24]